jgi:hypothetical protein
MYVDEVVCLSLGLNEKIDFCHQKCMTLQNFNTGIMGNGVFQWYSLRDLAIHQKKKNFTDAIC